MRSLPDTAGDTPVSLSGLKRICLMFVRDYTDDEATIIMVDSNIQREDILPSEKAKGI